MKKVTLILPFLILGLSFILINCTKDKTTAPIVSNFITADCPDTIKFVKDIMPIISDNCTSCHANGQSPQISDYATVSANAEKILNSFTGSNGLPFMPQGGNAVNDSLIQKFKCWISQGKLNN